MPGTEEGKIGITLVNQVRASSIAILGIVLMLIALYFLDFNLDAIRIFSIFWIALILPVVYLHVEYFFSNLTLKLSLETDKLVLNKGGKDLIYVFTDIEKVILYKSASIDKGGIPMSPMEMYHYARIITKSGEELIITCLMVPKLSELLKQLKGVKLERKKRPFCTIFWR
ncbi:MAG: hypothetical protein ABJF04_21570 [Reichenbachiella sp.]|uniref:hypothetical protein n=1 Tax=Reichenbachiella sp. TaxID=2184521 RepID=UPI0032653895